MVFKGFTDENGNVIPVQGAGTVYNEEKNSLALGKDTVASGQDQLVFGRKNIEDKSNAYVEIVGGGYNKVSVGYGSTVIYEDVELEYIGTKDDVNEYLKSLTAEQQRDLLCVQGNSTERQSILEDFESARKVYVRRLSYPHVNNPELVFYKIKTTPVYGGYGCPLLIAILNTGSNLIDTNTQIVSSGALGIDYTSGEKELYFDFYNYNYKILSGNTKNIRTLDWFGNQWNAGDITCDDGNGNTISMRDLLSRITTLEAAAANS